MIARCLAGTLLGFPLAAVVLSLLLRALPDAAFERAKVLSRQQTPKLGTRTADLLHVAAAVELGAVSLFSFDLQQRKMAQAAGLKLNRWP